MGVQVCRKLEKKLTCCAHESHEGQKRKGVGRVLVKSKRISRNRKTGSIKAGPYIRKWPSE